MMPLRFKDQKSHLRMARVLWFFILVMVSPLPLLGIADGASPRILVATVERVVDGDTVVALSENGTKLRLRLIGIDAPEITQRKKPGQPFGEEAKDYLEHLIGGKSVRLEDYGPDLYKKRVLAVIWDGQVNVNLLVVAMGYAEVYRGTRCQAYCRELEQAEAQAKRDRVGMWEEGASYESPAAFRKRLRLQGD